jgi:hypothetical protein
MLPSFFSYDLAQKILVIGKSINYLRLCAQKLPTSAESKQGVEGKSRGKGKGKGKGKKGMPRPSVADALGYRQDAPVIEKQDETSKGEVALSERGDKNDRSNIVSNRSENEMKDDIYTDDLLGITAEEEAALYSLRYGSEDQLAQVVSQISLKIDSRLLRMMQEDFCLYDHLLALKKFMLLGQGDFVTCLMDAVGPELQKPPSKLYRHNLTGILEGALRASNAQYEESYVINRVQVR